MSVFGRASVALLSTALVVSIAATGQAASAASTASKAPTAPPSRQAATWLARQLNSEGLIHNGQFKFDDYGLTADTAFALDALGGQKPAVRKIRKALAHHVDSYTTGADFGTPNDRYAGAIAKLVVLAQDTGGRARHFGGVNLVSRLAARVSTTAPTAGRIEDRSGFGDNANAIGQVFAVRGLLKAHHALGQPALRFLLKQQCAAGFFRLGFNSDTTAADQGCAKGSPADTDVTALAVIELGSVRKGHPALRDALTSAVHWLKKHQRDNGGFGGGPTTSGTNANSTGLAGWAFIETGQCGAEHRAAAWLRARQVRGDVAKTPLKGQSGAIAYDGAALKAAKADGITQATRDQWRRATAQAAPALLALHTCLAA